jgi:tetraacyldisaccharide 4'-kinase
LKSVEFELPVISIGNITTGGTGKTPHVEYLLQLLSDRYCMAVLSRGYKRKTKGFVLADKESLPEEIGDESFQILQKFDSIIVAVDEQRVRGIELLIQKIKDLSCILLDDAYQHRYVSSGLSVLLIDFYRPVYKDHLLPLGDLRESRRGVKRADIVIVTKVPDDIGANEQLICSRNLKLLPHQLLYFTNFHYGNLMHVFGRKDVEIDPHDLDQTSTEIILVAGIANPEPLYRELLKFCKSLHLIKFPDHHTYSITDLVRVKKKFDAASETTRLIITTEKDAVKIRNLPDIDNILKDFIYYIPVKIKFADGKQKEFEQRIFEYVAKNKRIGCQHN